MYYVHWDRAAVRAAAAPRNSVRARVAAKKGAKGFGGTFPRPCMLAEVAAGAGETAAIAVNGAISSKTNEAAVAWVEAADYGLTSVCSAYGAAAGAKSAFNAARAASKSKSIAAAARAAASVGNAANAFSFLCNAAEAATSVLVATDPQTDDDTTAHLAAVNTYTDMACTAIALAMGIATADPVMILASAIALTIQLVTMIISNLPPQSEIDPRFNAGHKVQVYEQAYAQGECLSEVEHALLTPLLMFYTELHSSAGNSRYGFYVDAVDYSDSSPNLHTFSRNLYPAFPKN